MSYSLTDIFNNIYTSKLWVNGSGSGSNPIILSNYITYLNDFIKEHNIKTIVDIGCGDWQYFCKINLDNITYYGYDVSSEIIERNKQKFAKDNIHFILYSGDFSEVKGADLLICKDVLQHLPNEYILNFMKILNNYEYALISNNIGKYNNNSKDFTIENTKQGQFHSINLQDAPFNLDCKKVVRTYRPDKQDIVTVLWSKHQKSNKAFEKTQTKVNILYACDRHYIKLTCVSIESVIRNSKSDINFYIAYFKAEKEYVEQDLNLYIQSIKPFLDKIEIDVSFITYCVDDEDLIQKFVVPHETSSAITPSCYIRFLITDIVKDKSLCLYLDGDTIVRDDLSALFELNLADNYIASVEAPYISKEIEYKTNIGLKPSHKYVNSGVILFNLSLLRSDDMKSELLTQIGKLNEGKLYCCDQDIINFVFQGRIYYLDSKYNYLVSNNTEVYDSLPTIIHYNNVYKR